ncbi:hypothetical protein CRUP_000161, partial [Coryphaenoides rupestris]
IYQDLCVEPVLHDVTPKEQVGTGNTLPKPPCHLTGATVKVGVQTPESQTPYMRSENSLPGRSMSRVRLLSTGSVNTLGCSWWSRSTKKSGLKMMSPRSAHPHVHFSCLDAEPMVIDKVPFDKYELEPSPLTQYILERKSPHTCWQVFVCNSAKYSDLGQPFGYLKASTALNCVNLFVMPYNYPVLLPLLDDLIKVHKFKPTIKWRQSFENYLKTMPPYYIGPLKKALRIMGAPNLLADNEYGLSYSVVSYLKKLSQQSKIEYDRLITSIGKKPPPPEPGIKVRWRGGGPISLAQRWDFNQLLQSITGESASMPQELSNKEFQGFHLALLN